MTVTGEAAGEVVVEAAGERVARGRAVDLRDPVPNPDVTLDASPEAIVAAVHGGGPATLRVDCPAPTARHRILAVPDAPDAPSLRALLAAAARSRGLTAPQRSELDEVRRRLRDVDPEPVDLRAARRRVAETGTRETELRERVAALRGRVSALREREGESSPDSGVDVGGDTAEIDESGETAQGGAAPSVEAAEADLRDAAARLSEVTTERIAAEQALSRARTEVRRARTERERRLRLEDREANLERAARDHLARAVYERFAAAVERMPGDVDPAAAPDDYDGDRTTAWHAAVRVADLRAPVVVTDRRFGSAAEAATRLDAPVVRL